MKKTLALIGMVSFFAVLRPAGSWAATDTAPGQVKKLQGNVVQQTAPGILKKTATISARPKIGAGALKNLIASVSAQRKTATPPGLLKRMARLTVRAATPGAALKRHAIYGVITAINGDVLTLTHPLQRSRAVSLTVDAQTVIRGGGTAMTLADLAVGNRIVAVGVPQQAGGILAVRIQVIPGLAAGIGSRFPSPTAAPTLTLMPSPSTTPSATPTLPVPSP